MIVAVLFAVLSAFLFLSFCYLADLLIFIYRENKIFQLQKEDPAYRFQLEERHKGKKSGRKKNYLLYLLIQTFLLQGEQKRGESLIPFLKNDSLLGIKKEASI